MNYKGCQCDNDWCEQIIEFSPCLTDIKFRFLDHIIPNFQKKQKRNLDLIVLENTVHKDVCKKLYESPLKVWGLNPYFILLYLHCYSLFIWRRLMSLSSIWII